MRVLTGAQLDDQIDVIDELEVSQEELRRLFKLYFRDSLVAHVRCPCPVCRFHELYAHFTPIQPVHASDKLRPRNPVNVHPASLKATLPTSIGTNDIIFAHFKWIRTAFFAESTAKEMENGIYLRQWGSKDKK